ncbi:MAG: metallophosphoesterase family protein [archaeon]|nr:metallophosphoesterase family protein [archaeon]
MTEQQNLKEELRVRRRMKLSKYSSILIITNSFLLLIFILLLIFLFRSQMAGGDIALLPGMGASVSTFIIILILDHSKKYREKLKKLKIPSHWIVTIFCSQFFGLIGLIFYIFNANLENFNLAFSENTSLLVYIIVLIIGNIISFMLYSGIKNLGILKAKPSEFKKIKLRLYLLTAGLIFILLTSLLSILGYISFIFPPASILGGNGHNDGPWLSWSNNQPDTSISITWLTSELNTTTVYYGTNPLNLDNTGYGIESGESFLHKTVITDLSPNTIYYYRIPEKFEQHPANTIFNFTTASSTEESFKFAIYGDVQPTDENYILQNQLVVDGLINGSFDFICRLGDDADDGGDPEDWHRFFQSYARVAAYTPSMNVIGNHDWDYLEGGSSNWGALFNNPYNNSNQGRYYSFDYHNAHFLMLDNFEHIYSMSDIQLNWIKDDITNARTKDPDSWVFVLFHLSMFTTASTGHIYDLQKQLIPIFDEYGVDAVFYGHDHHYEHYNYTYGNNGLYFNQEHENTANSNEMHIFCSGGGGADLEVRYGVLDDGMHESNDIRFWNSSSNNYEDIQFVRKPWNNSKYLNHTNFAENYTHQAITGGEHEGKYYYHAPDMELYDDYAGITGFDYGEQTFQFMQLEIDGNTCTISSRYPNGVLLTGPDDNYPQIWTLTK